ncbi:MAG: YciI family protein [Bryobacteraceae bacterium]
MIIRKADKETEAGALPAPEMMAAMMKYNGELAAAGALLQAEGLKPSSEGARVSFAGGKPLVTDGPFVETKELIAGFTMIDVKSREEAIAWVKRWPAIDGNAVLEIRPFYESGDFQ